MKCQGSWSKTEITDIFSWTEGVHHKNKTWKFYLIFVKWILDWLAKDFYLMGYHFPLSSSHYCNQWDLRLNFCDEKVWNSSWNFTSCLQGSYAPPSPKKVSSKSDPMFKSGPGSIYSNGKRIWLRIKIVSAYFKL